MSAPRAIGECSVRAGAVVQESGFVAERGVEGRQLFADDGEVRRPRRGRDALVPDLAEAGVLPADQMIRIGAGGAGRCKHGYGGGHGGTGDRKTTHGKSPV
ncbi:MAG: hypothetical protein CFE30_16635 [Bradyrhizobium sp. PARBB1]|nr:MAG: hypothetical protein CFE30_16635 [Bradyrhizobium sp. PARBB1]